MSRRTLPFSLLGALAVLTAGCGGEAAAPASAETATAAPASAASDPPPPPAAAAGAPPAAAAAPAKAAPKLTSLPATPVAAGDLRDAYFHWDRAEVVVAGHPATFFDQDPWSRVDALTALPEKGAPELVSCRFRSTPEGRVARTALVAVRGRITARSWVSGNPAGTLALEDCEVVAEGDAVQATGDPWRLDGQPVPVQALWDAAFGWQGRTVQVSGRYDSSTHSSAGDVQRHDIADASGKVAVGCAHQGSARAPASAVSDREGVVVEGTLAEPQFGSVILEDCRFVNRS